MMVAIQSAIDIATDLIAEGRLRRPESYRETFEILGENGILPEPLTRDLSDLAGFRNVLVHIYWNLNLEQTYAILHQNLWHPHSILRCHIGASPEAPFGRSIGFLFVLSSRRAQRNLQGTTPCRNSWACGFVRMLLEATRAANSPSTWESAAFFDRAQASSAFCLHKWLCCWPSRPRQLAG